MDVQYHFQKISLGKSRDFSWVFLVDWILTCIVTLTVIFYLGRIFGYMLTFVLEWVVWKRYKIKISIESLRIAPLGGNIIIRNLCIIHRDYTVSCLKGTISWRYWLLNVRKSLYQENLDKRDDEENLENGRRSKINDEGNNYNRKRPCRFVISCEGLEVFIYNKTSSYENIIHMFSKEERAQFEKFMDDMTLASESDCSDKFSSNRYSSTVETNMETMHSSDSRDDPSNAEADDDHKDETDRETSNDLDQDDENLRQGDSSEKTMSLNFLPMEFAFHRFSLVLGNRFTPSILVTSVKNSNGILDLCPPKEKLDLFNIRLEKELYEVDVSLKQNIGFDDEMSATFRWTKGKLSRFWKKFTHLLHLPILVPSSSQSQEDVKFHEGWKGLSLYRQDTMEDELENIEFDFANHEYARVVNILKSAKIVFIYEYDMPGLVPRYPVVTDQGPEVGNGGAPPELNVDVQLYGANICYGPWTERQLAPLRALFSPVVSRTPKPVKTLKRGSRRIYTIFRTSISVMEESTWRIPTREKSKDQEFLKHFLETKEEFRPFGWIDLKFMKDSCGFLDAVICPTKEGTSNKANFHFSNMEIRSSVNHELLLRSQYFDLEANMKYPLDWSDQANWNINISSTQLEMFILREHITLISDVSRDFSSGDPTPYELFRPFIYEITWNLEGYSIYLNVNDHNIVNNPLDFNENCYLSFHGDRLTSEVKIPHQTVSNRCTEITYRISTPVFRLLLNAPPWNTLNEFLMDKEVGRSYEFLITGVYTIFSDLDVDNVDTISFECTSLGTTLHCYGFVIRYLMNLKMNYFGDFSHFVTAEEYSNANCTEGNGHKDLEESSGFALSSTDEIKDGIEIETNAESGRNHIPRPSDVRRTENEMDIWFVFSVWEGALILPETIYNSDPCIALHFSQLDLDFRSNNYYMDLLTVMNNTKLRRYISKQPNDLFECVRKNNGRQEESHGYLSNLTVHAHRMFGLPPTEPTYFCQWGVDIDHLEVNSDLDFAKGFSKCFDKMGFGFKNLENILLYDINSIFDMTSVTVRVKELKFVVTDEDTKSKSIFNGNKITFTSIDFENENYSKRLDVKIPDIEFFIFQLDDELNEVELLLRLKTKLNFTDFIQNPEFADHRCKQREHIALHDSPYYRCSFILPCFFQESILYKELLGSISPSSSLPPLPLPVLADTLEYIIEDLLGEYVPDFKHDDVSFLETTYSSNDISFEATSRFSPVRDSRSHHDNYDNYVLDVEYINLELKSPVIGIIIDYLGKFYEENIIDIIDNNEVAIVKRLADLKHDVSFVTTLRLHVNDFNLLYDFQIGSGIELALQNFDCDLEIKSAEKEDEKVILEKNALINLPSLRVALLECHPSEMNDKIPPLQLTVEDLEFWSSAVNESVNSLNVISFGLSGDMSRLEEIADYLFGQIQTFRHAVTSFKELNQLKNITERDLICDLTSASDYYQISHDPYVITKPAFIMRLSKGHVRENRSWRIVTRLRHILTYLPADWNDAGNLAIIRRLENPDPFHTDENIFISVFSNWRDWELSDITKSYIYRKIFLQADENSFEEKLRTKLKINFQSLLITLFNSEYEISHSIMVTNTNIILDSPPLISKTNSDNMFDKKNDLTLTIHMGSVSGEFGEEAFILKEAFSKCNRENNESYSIFDTVTSHHRSVSNLRSPVALTKSENTYHSANSYKYPRIFFTILFEKSDLQLELGEIRLGNKIINGKYSMLYENSKDSSHALSAAFFTQRHEIWLKQSNDLLVELFLKETNVTATAWQGSLPFVFINCQSSGSLLRAMSTTVVLVDSIKRIKKKYDALTTQFEFGRSERSLTVNDQSQHTRLKFDVRLNLIDIRLEIMPLFPLFLLQDMRQLNVYIGGKDKMELSFEFLEYDIYLKSQLSSEQLFKFSLADFQIKCVLPDEISRIVDLQVSTSLMKLTFGELRRVLNNLLQDERFLVKSIAYMQGLWEFFHSDQETASNKGDKSPLENLRWALDANLKYFGILLPISSVCYVLELHSLIVSLANVNEQYEDDKRFSGQIAVESCFLLMKRLSLPTDLSKLLDFSITFLTLQKIPNALQSYQIESSYFRICLFPELLVDILWSIQYVESLFHYFKRHHVPWFPHSFHEASKDAESPIDFRSIHILSYNFCIGWLFGLDQSTEPGLILGYDRLFSAYEGNFGKLTLIDGYLSVADGNTSDTFYSQKSERDSYNRTYLSNMQIFYWLKGTDLQKDMFVRFHGEAIDVRFLSSTFQLVEMTLQSIRFFSELKRSKIRHTESSSKNKTNVESASNTLAPLLAHVRIINSRLSFAGGIFKVYSESEPGGKPQPLLEIRSPGVKISVNYEFDNSKDKPYWIRILTTVEPTHNVLFAHCASILRDFTDNFKKMVRNLSTEDKPTSSRPVVESMNFKSLLDPYDIAFGISSGKQVLSFSCEPKAKVQLDTGFNSFLFRVTTNNKDPIEPFSVSFSVDKIESSVKHIFSRDSSAAFMVDYVDIITMFTHPNVYGAALISNMNIYCNMKQMQNLNLFLDIWGLSNRVRTEPEENKTENKKNITSFASQSPDNQRNVFPFSFTIIITNAGGVVDLGPSLGVLTMDLERCWVTTKRQDNQKRIWHSFLSGITTHSEGRLSGIFEIDHAISVFEMTWPNESPLRIVPLISLSLEINNIAVKSAFDYHMFLIGSMRGVQLQVHNESDVYTILPDLLQVSLQVESVIFCGTALTPANIVDIYNTILRMQRDNNISYVETLEESNNSGSSATIPYENIIKSLNLLRTDLSVTIKEFGIHISPMSLFDREVLIVSFKNLSTRSGTKSGDKLKTELQLQISDVDASLSSTKEELDEEMVSRMTVDDYMRYTSKFSGGCIIKIPQLLVGMTTWQQEGSRVVEYLFSCKFLDKISMRWNLGPIAFIKEMWATHVKSLAVRRSQTATDAEFPSERPEDDVTSRFIYVPLDEPYIEMPQIRDLGNATPPVEWFGVHRKNLPPATHKTAVLFIQKLVHTVEKEYAKIQQRT